MAVEGSLRASIAASYFPAHHPRHALMLWLSSTGIVDPPQSQRTAFPECLAQLRHRNLLTVLELPWKLALWHVRSEPSHFWERLRKRVERTGIGSGGSLGFDVFTGQLCQLTKEWSFEFKRSAHSEYLEKLEHRLMANYPISVGNWISRTLTFHLEPRDIAGVKRKFV